MAVHSLGYTNVWDKKTFFSCQCGSCDIIEFIILLKDFIPTMSEDGMGAMGWNGVQKRYLSLLLLKKIYIDSRFSWI